MNIRDYLKQKLKRGTVHITYLDPLKQVPETAGRLAQTAQEVSSDLILIGGSSGVTQRNLTDTVAVVKEKVNIPVVFLPAGGEALSLNFDAFFFLSLFNSRSTHFITGAHSRVSLLIKRLGVEVLPMGYIVVEPGMKVSEIGEVDLVARDDVWSAIGYALTAELFGMSFIYLDAGSGAAQPVPAGMIRAVRREVSIPLVVGGGIRTAIDARRVRQAGADIVVTGTIIENAGYRERLRSILSALKE